MSKRQYTKYLPAFTCREQHEVPYWLALIWPGIRNGKTYHSHYPVIGIFISPKTSKSSGIKLCIFMPSYFRNLLMPSYSPDSFSYAILICPVCGHKYDGRSEKGRNFTNILRTFKLKDIIYVDENDAIAKL